MVDGKMEDCVRIAHGLQGTLDRLRGKKKRRVAKNKANFEKELQELLRHHLVLKGLGDMIKRKS